MSFASEQLEALQGNLPPEYVRLRKLRGRRLSYIEGWYAISEANRIFGFDGWDRETVESRCVFAREFRGAFHAFYAARIRITVRAGAMPVIREGHGTGDGRGATASEAHELAIKSAETDATKRALATFGRAFGLELHRTQAPPVQPENGKARNIALGAATITDVPTISDRLPISADSIEEDGSREDPARPARRAARSYQR